MLHRTLSFIIIIFLGFQFSALSQVTNYSFEEQLQWEKVQHIKISTGFSFDRLKFWGAYYNGENTVPYFENQYPIHSSLVELSASIDVKAVTSLSDEEKVLLEDVKVDTAFVVSVSKVNSREQTYAAVNVIPIRFNPATGKYEKLLSFIVDVQVKDVEESTTRSISHASTSVLASGEWFKVRISEDGIYKVTYNELKQMGFDVSANPNNIAVFGNGGGVLPEQNDMFRHDDLVENPIFFKGADDNKFNEGDYFLFYGQGPVQWKLNKITNTFFHQNDIYDDYAYYFITTLNHPAKRIEDATTPTENADVTVNSFIDYAVHELDEKNIASTGRLWVGEVFDFNTNQSFEFDFPNIIVTKPAYFRGSFAATSPTISAFKVLVNDVLLTNIPVSATPSNGYNFGRKSVANKSFVAKSDKFNVELQYQRTSNSSTGYLDYLEFNAYRKLIMTGSQMIFRNVFNEGNVAQYQLQGPDNLTVWDVTNPVEAMKVDMNYAGGTYTFKSSIDSINQFVAFDGSEYKNVEFVENVANQNLHAIRNIDYLIVAHPDFVAQANRLAQFHYENDGLTYAVVTPQQIYNEFSSGAQDISAIRDFAKMLYDESEPGKKLKYLLLFGDASFDYKDRISDNTNFVPCWESWESFNIINSVATDDYFGCLDDGEGTGGNDKVDIGIGRFPVVNEAEARLAVDKVVHYSTKSDTIFGPWRNVITFLADDGDYNTHLNDAETLSNYLNENYPAINLDKIYLDAYNQISTPSGQRAPEVNNAISTRIDKGTLIFNYSGHGGEIGLGHERFLQLADINSWTNWDKLAVFITATCEFSRYDDPARVSAGEQVFLNPKGGGVALFSTSRATYASANLALNMAIYKDNLFTKKDGKYPAFGDVIMNSKVVGGDNDRKFILLGDPAQKLAYPDFEAKTLKINQHVVADGKFDTLRALQYVTIEGDIVDESGDVVTGFNGDIFPTVYDKESKVMTKGTDDDSNVVPFYLWKSIIFSGKASIINGHFSFDFVVPKDIGYNYGKGRISYYFNSDTKDGTGYYENIIIGGYNDGAGGDTEGPDITLFINDTLFHSGDITDENPVLLAFVEDESGINTTGNGIGHDIVANIDGSAEDNYVLNDFYSSDVNRYNKGVISFPLHNIAEGWHTLTLKVWDIYNNSSEASIDFKVISSKDMVVDKLYNYPNPFYDGTTFVFSHNQAEQPMEVTVKIYTVTGQLVKTIKKSYASQGYVSSQIHWNGNSDGGEKLSQGVYVYKLLVKNSSGRTDVKNAKLIITK